VLQGTAPSPGHLPSPRVAKFAPPIDALPHATNKRGQVVLLRLGPERLRGLVEDDLLPLDTLCFLVS
jgi:hypothetical protein